jgi:hypothetical protein
MGCGASKGDDDGAKGKKQQKQPPNGKKGEGYKNGDDPVPINTITKEEDDPDLDDGNPSPLARKESAAVSASEPGDFVAKMKSAYQVRKAKFNGANEDVDQYMDEIRESIPVLAKRERARIQEWVDSIGDANPGDVFEEMPPEGTIAKRLSVASTTTGPGRESASDSGAGGEPRSPLLPLGNYGKQSSSIGAIASENTATGLASESEAGSPKKEDNSQQQQQHQLPGQVPEQQTSDAGAVPLLQVTSAGSHRPDAEKRRSSRRQSAVSGGGGGGEMGTPDINALEAPSEGASAANPDDATQSHGGGGGGSDGSQVMEGGDFVFA